MAVRFTDEEFRLITEWLANEYGIRFGPEKRDILRARLEPSRLELGLETFEQLYFHLKFHPERAVERERLLTRVTNNESYFFRERKQLDLLHDEVLPALRRRIRKGGEAELRILSAGAAGGEEAYTLAMIARNAAGPRVDLRVTGLDIDVAALERARRGAYREHALRGVDDGTRARWFDRDGDSWQLRSPPLGTVEFLAANLVDGAWPDTLPPQHVVFCRNVLIYFDERATRRAVDALYRVLVPGGYLFLGHAESLSRLPTRFLAERRPGALFYRRPEA